MGILLTDEEKAIAVQDEMERVGEGQMRGYGDIVQYALLKKVVEWGNHRCAIHSTTRAYFLRCNCEKCWQALLKEVE